MSDEILRVLRCSNILITPPAHACAVWSLKMPESVVDCRLSCGVTNRLLDKCVHSMIFRYFLLTFVDNVIRFGSAMRMLTALLTVFF